MTADDTARGSAHDASLAQQPAADATSAPRPATTSLSQQLRHATAELHRQVERAGVMPLLLRGGLPPPPAYRSAYCALLRNLYAIYVPLEAALAEHAAHPALAPLALPGLARSAALAQDLALLAGADWADAAALPLTAAAAAYAQRLQALRDSAPALLAAHAYVRYLGDLSGGQVLRRIVRQALALPAGEPAGTCFYDFGDAAQAAQLAARLRAGLDAIGPGQVSHAALVDEARAAFARHRALFEELQAGIVGA